MKRFRVWQANRQVYLYPENWLEPELRGDKSPIFRDLEAELLKSDITDDLADDGYFAYLKKLDEVARLEIAGSFLEERTPGKSEDDILHVFGRTNGNTRQYYYRRREAGFWTAWDKVSLHIQGDVLLPMVWKSQLFLFSVSVVHKPDGAAPKQSAMAIADAADWSQSATVTAELNLVWGEYFQGKWTSPKSSDPNHPFLLTGMAKFEPEKVTLLGRTEDPGGGMSERLVISMTYLGTPATSYKAIFTSKNCAPTIADMADLTVFSDVGIFNYNLLWAPTSTTSLIDSNSLSEPGTIFTVRVNQPQDPAVPPLDQVVLSKVAPLQAGFHVRPLMHEISDQWNAPLFYSDEHSVFYVEQNAHVELVWNYSSYYWFDVASILAKPARIGIASLYEPPIVKDRFAPATHPLEAAINPNFRWTIPDASTFNFADRRFGVGGLIAQGD